ncbi:uncharacterized protein LOC111028544 [Myzus persicae]|uniref:uncharacterized protein LOC111028544 n=1 Tax=Myzus persicae TaxID=13164 RepID=UPI000B9371E5|nr:uncharacterized protein LOC111028544 [Myzus persicae]
MGDSLSSLTGINNLTNPSDISKLIHEKTYELSQKGIGIAFLWIPGHCGIDGNELADQEASKAASSTDTHILNFSTYTDLKKLIQTILYHKWQNLWIKQNTKLNTIKNNIQVWRNPGLNRKDETIINRLRIGHTFVTHNYLMAIKAPPICEACGVEFTVKHIIIDCSKYADSRSKQSIPYQLSEALQPDLQSNINIVNFLKETKLYNLI